MGVSPRNAKSNMTERKIYEILGVRLFRKAVMAFERLRHKKDGGTNSNYHPKNSSLSSSRAFRWYVIYNSIFHVISLVFSAVYFVITRVSCEIFLAADILVSVVIVFNLFCLMLQRYTWLALTEHIALLERRREGRIAKRVSFIENTVLTKEESEACAEFDLISKMMRAAECGEDLVLTSEEAPVLRGISELSGTGERRKDCHRSSENAGICDPILAQIPPRVYVTDKTERRVSSLQKIIGVPWRENVRFSYSVIIDDAECERIYREIFHAADGDEVYAILEAIHRAYNKRMGRGGGEE